SELKILDVGCSKGYGVYIMKLICPTCHFVGVDLNGDDIKTAKELLSDFQDIVCLSGDITNEHFVEYLLSTYGPFDVITCFEVYEHIKPETADTFLNNISLLLKQDGLLFISTPNKRIYDTDAYTPDHVNEVSPQQFLRKLEMTGFSPIYIFGSYTKHPFLVRSLEF
ncbi:methyltransferase domain-containing protein, partial [Thermococcus sp. M39]